MAKICGQELIEISRSQQKSESLLDSLREKEWLFLYAADDKYHWKNKQNPTFLISLKKSKESLQTVSGELKAKTKNIYITNKKVSKFTLHGRFNTGVCFKLKLLCLDHLSSKQIEHSVLICATLRIGDNIRYFVA
jgi:hypothetical protein